MFRTPRRFLPESLLRALPAGLGALPVTSRLPLILQPPQQTSFPPSILLIPSPTLPLMPLKLSITNLPPSFLVFPPFHSFFSSQLPPFRRSSCPIALSA